MLPGRGAIKLVVRFQLLLLCMHACEVSLLMCGRHEDVCRKQGGRHVTVCTVVVSDVVRFWIDGYFVSCMAAVRFGWCGSSSMDCHTLLSLRFFALASCLFATCVVRSLLELEFYFVHRARPVTIWFPTTSPVAYCSRTRSERRQGRSSSSSSFLYSRLACRLR
jgi:hypothetical protein